MTHAETCIAEVFIIGKLLNLKKIFFFLFQFPKNKLTYELEQTTTNKKRRLKYVSLVQENKQLCRFNFYSVF